MPKDDITPTAVISPFISDEDRDRFEAAQAKDAPRIAEIDAQLEAEKAQAMQQEKSSSAEKKQDMLEYTYSADKIAALADNMAQILRKHIFQSCGVLYRVETLAERKAYGKFTLAAGTAVLSPMTPDDIAAILNKHVIFKRFKGSTKQYVVIPVPAPVINQICNGKFHWNPIPVISGLVRSPIIRDDGSVLSKAGFDEKTGLYADFTESHFIQVKKYPTKKDAENALEIIKDAICEFPFKTDVDKSVAIAGIMTPFIRISIQAAPMFAITATKFGSGKTALADLIAIISTGKPANVFNYVRDQREFAKSLFAVLLTSPSNILVDNVEGILKSDALCTMLTQESISDRILGFSKYASVSTSTTWMATGNNLQPAQDMIRRTAYCQLDAEVERPYERTFKRKDIKAWALQERSKLVHSILTIIRAHHCAGYPGKKDMRPWANYEHWSEFIRGALLWLGLPDPMENLKVMEALDPIQEANTAALAAWYACYESKPVTCAQIIRDLEINRTAGDKLRDEKLDALNDALSEAITSTRGFTSRALGTWLSKYNGSIFGGFKAVKGPTKQKIATWRIKPVK